MEFKKEAEAKSKLPDEESQQGAGSGGMGLLGGFSSAPSQAAAAAGTKKSLDAGGSTETRGSVSMDSVRPIWQNKESMSPLMRQIVQAKEIR